MKKLLPVLLTFVLAAACAAQDAKRAARIEDFVGTYEAEHVIDSIERIWLRSDGSFTFEFRAVVGEVSGYRGRWILREHEVILVARDKEGKEVEFPLQVITKKDTLALIYSEESYRTTAATMLLPNTYRRTTKKTPNQPPEPTAPSGRGSS